MEDTPVLAAEAGYGQKVIPRRVGYVISFDRQRYTSFLEITEALMRDYHVKVGLASRKMGKEGTVPNFPGRQ